MSDATHQSAVIVEELIQQGVTDVVLCPGSRNAPLSYACHRADAEGRIRLHVRIDERGAGYLAIGLATGSGRPVPVVTTSGTAVANLAPAVLEANHRRVPLIVLSANRPYDLVGTGASQTVQQVGLFADQVRATVSLRLAGASSGDESTSWRASVARAVISATGARSADPGPVQLDVPFDDPLAPDFSDPTLLHPDAGECSRIRSTTRLSSTARLNGVPVADRTDSRWTSAPSITVDAPVDIDLTPDTLVVAGDGAERCPTTDQLPTIAEPTAPRPVNPVNPLALGLLEPRQVIVTGRPTLHRGVNRLLADPGVEVVALAQGPHWPDVAGTVRTVGTHARPFGRPCAGWLERCRTASERADRAISAELGACPAITGLHVAQIVGAALGRGDQLFVGASNSIRDIAIAGCLGDDLPVYSNRGVAGIDGNVSTAVGLALARPELRTTAMIGDLTFLHDANGLVIGPDEPVPEGLRFVVPNDDGGGIFSLLEHGDPRAADTVYAGAHERTFRTPHGTRIGALCAAVGADHRRVDITELADALREEPVSSVPEVIEVRTDSSGLRQLHHAIVDRLRC